MVALLRGGRSLPVLRDIPAFQFFPLLLHFGSGGAAELDPGLLDLIQRCLDRFLRPGQGILGVFVGHLVELAGTFLRPVMICRAFSLAA